VTAIATMTVDLASDFFKLFALPAGFAIDEQQLSQRYRELQTEFHPDRFATADSLTRRQAMQMAAHLNEAYTTLKDPLRRSAYLLQKKGINTNAEKESTADPAFLMQQLEYREQLEGIRSQADPLSALDNLKHNLQNENRQLLAAFEQAYNEGRLDDAKKIYLKLQFFARLLQQLHVIEASIEDEALI
jgi:molecular chaperone HscB